MTSMHRHEHECDLKTPFGFAAASYVGDVWTCEHGFVYERSRGATEDWTRRQ